MRGRFKISDGGNSGLYFRVAYGPGWPDGYEAQINSTMSDPQKTGSLYDLVKNATTLVPPDTWFDYDPLRRTSRAACTSRSRSTASPSSTSWTPRRKHASGRIALQQHNDGSVIQGQGPWIREAVS